MIFFVAYVSLLHMLLTPFYLRWKKKKKKKKKKRKKKKRKKKKK